MIASKRADHWTSEMRSKLEEVATEASGIKRDAEQFLKAYPVATTVAFLTMGVFLGWLLKRS